MLKWVELWAWRPRHAAIGGIGIAISGLLGCALPTLWGGLALLWKGIGASEVSVFSDLVAQTMEAADAQQERLSKLRALKRGFKDRLLRLAATLVWPFLVVVMVGFYGGLLKATGAVNLWSLKLAIWTAGGVTWLLPALLFSPWRGGELGHQVAGQRAVIVSIVLLGAWAANALGIGWLLGLALTLAGGSLGLFTAVAISWTKQVQAQETWQTPGDAGKERSPLTYLFGGDVFGSGSSQFSAAGVVYLLGITALFGVANFRTWRAAAAVDVYLADLSASGKVLPHESYLPPRVPNEANFAKTPLLQAIGFRTRLETNRWAQWVAFQALADPNGTFRLHPSAGPVLRASPGQTDLTATSRSAQAAEILRALSPLDADLEELRQAAGRAFAQVDPAGLDDSMQDPNRPHSPGFRLLARLFLVRAAAELELGHSEAAWRDLRVVQRLADALGANRSLDSTLLRAGLVQSCQEGFWEGWVTGRWTLGDLRQWESWLASVDLLRDLGFSLRGEEARVLNTIFDGQSVSVQSMPVVPFPWIWFRDQRLYNQLLFGYCDAAFDAARQQVRPARADAFQAQAAKTLKENSTRWQIAYYRYPNLDPVLPKLAYAQTLVNLARVAGALTRHRADTGEYPPALEKLAPRYLASVPHDLIGGNPLIYRRTAENESLVYSVGWNERDDDGTPPESPFDLRHGDWVWPGSAKRGE